MQHGFVAPKSIESWNKNLHSLMLPVVNGVWSALVLDNLVAIAKHLALEPLLLQRHQ